MKLLIFFAVLNVVTMVWMYYTGNFATGMFNGFAAGFCARGAMAK